MLESISYNSLYFVFAKIDFNLLKTQVEAKVDTTANGLYIIHPLDFTRTFSIQLQLISF